MFVCFYACRYKQLLQRKGELEELEKNLKQQQEKMALENETHQATADNCKQLKEENDRSDILTYTISIVFLNTMQTHKLLILLKYKLKCIFNSENHILQTHVLLHL